VRFSDGSTQVLRLGMSSRTTGATFHFPPRRTSSITITITGMTDAILSGGVVEPQTTFTGASPVGFAEVRIPGVAPVTSTLQLPTDMLAGAGTKGNKDPLVILLHRLRAATIPPRTDPELSMSRTFELPSARSFVISGTARVSDLLDDPALDTLLGRGQGTGLHVVSTSSSSRLTGSLANSSWAAFDANPDTSWSPAYVGPLPVWLSAMLSSQTSIDQVSFHVVVDGRHSVPRTVVVSTNTGRHAVAALRYEPGTRVGTGQGATETAVARFAPIAGTSFKFTFPSIRELLTTDHISGLPTELPIGIADVLVPGVASATTPPTISPVCRPGLLSIDGKDVPIRITGSTSDAIAQRALSITGCGAPTRLTTGSHLLRTAPGHLTGWNLDTLALRSGSLFPPPPGPTAAVTDLRWTNNVTAYATVSPQSLPSWLVLDQSFSSGWRATIDGHDLGAPELMDGGFTAWQLPRSAKSATVEISWTPQSTVDVALLVSLAGLVLVLMLILLGGRRRSRHAATSRGGAPTDLEPLLAWPWRARTMSLPLCAAATVVSMAISGPAIAVIAVPLLALAWWRRPLRAVLALAPAITVALAGAYMFYEQHKYDWPHNIQWPTHFAKANTLGWIAVCILVIDVLAFREDPDPIVAADSDGLKGGLDPNAPQGLARIVPTRLAGLVSVVSPSKFVPPEELGRTGESVIALPASGIPRSVALFRAFRKEQSDPDYFYRTIALDTLVRLTGSTPLFNRTVVDIGGGAGYFAEAFRNAGARVVLIEPEADAPLPSRLQGPEQSLDLRERHERAVWPGRLMEGQTVAGDGLQLPLPDDFADLVFSSNVLEHVPDPSRFIDESVRVAKPGGQIYLSFTVWWSPWGGHETSPWHYLSGGYAKRRYTRRHGHPPKNVYGESLFALKVSTVLRLLRARDDVHLLAVEPRYLPRWAGFLVKVPVVREVVTWNLVTLLEKL